MLALLLLLLFLFVVALVSGLLSRCSPRDGEGGEASAPSAERPEVCKTCATGDESCYADKMLRGENCLEAVYFDDEDLDAYKGKPAEAYSEAEAEEFRQVLYTMKPGEVGEWLHSLGLRGIELPTELRDEALMLTEERS